MRQTTSAVFALLSLVAAVGAHAAPPGPRAKAEPPPPPEVPAQALHDGLWNLSTVREIPGTPYRRTVSSQDCRTAATSRVLPAVLPASTEEGMACQYPGAKLEGEVLSWSVQCAGKGGTLSGTASITLAGTSYQGTAQLERKAGGKLTKIKETFEGKRVGECQ